MPATPDYIRVADSILEQVESGALAPGDRLPSIAQLAEAHDVSVSTIKMAYVRLEALGAIVRRQGKGVYVADRSVEQRPQG